MTNFDSIARYYFNSNLSTDITEYFDNDKPSTNIYPIIGKFLRHNRLKSNLTGKEIASKIHISQQQWSRYELGHTKMDVGRLLNILSLLKVNTDDMFSFIRNELEKR